MHNTQELAKTIKTVAKSKGILIRDMLRDCNVSVNTLSTILLAIYNRLSLVDRAKLLLYADGLTHNVGSDGNDGNGSKDGKDGGI